MTTPLCLPAEVTIYVVAELRAAWLDWLSALQDDATVDGSRVDEVDAAGVQCLLALARSAAQRGHALRVAAPSATLRRACLSLGASHLLDEPAPEEHPA